MAVGTDEEKKAVTGEETTVNANRDNEGDEEKKKEQVLKEAPKMTNTFSWQHLNYIISAGRGGKKRKLLDGISGFVSPGKLTALMGESGAGKVRLIFSLSRSQTND